VPQYLVSLEEESEMEDSHDWMTYNVASIKESKMEYSRYFMIYNGVFYLNDNT